MMTADELYESCGAIAFSVTGKRLEPTIEKQADAAICVAMFVTMIELQEAGIIKGFCLKERVSQQEVLTTFAKRYADERKQRLVNQPPPGAAETVLRILRDAFPCG